jgi:hypothetical protein
MMIASVKNRTGRIRTQRLSGFALSDSQGSVCSGDLEANPPRADKSGIDGGSFKARTVPGFSGKRF